MASPRTAEPPPSNALDLWPPRRKDPISNPNEAPLSRAVPRKAAELGKRLGDRLDPVLRDLQSVTQAMGKDPVIFDPQSDKFWGVEAVQFAVDLLKRVPRGEDGTVRNIGAPAANGAYDKAWAKASMQKGHPDYEARTDPRHPRHAEISRLANEAYALG